MSWVLRHRPAEAGVHVDDQGWAAVPDLLEACARFNHPADEAAIHAVVAASDKQRFELDGDRIRARQGHSFPVELGLEATPPPETLFHGTVARFLPSIREHGLRPGQRHAVHLSADRQTAVTVGARRGKPVLLEISAGRMHREGAVFTRSTNGVWLVDAVPAHHLSFPD